MCCMHLIQRDIENGCARNCGAAHIHFHTFTIVLNAAHDCGGETSLLISMYTVTVDCAYWRWLAGWLGETEARSAVTSIGTNQFSECSRGERSPIANRARAGRVIGKWKCIVQKGVVRQCAQLEREDLEYFGHTSHHTVCWILAVGVGGGESSGFVVPTSGLFACFRLFRQVSAKGDTKI